MAASSKTDAAYQEIKRRIADGTHAPGTRLPLSPLAQEFGVSVLPVREALRRLEAEGLVRFERNVGATVAGFSDDDRRWTIEILATLNGVATAMSMPIPKAHVERAHEINEQMRAMIDEPDQIAFRNLEREFHDALNQRCDNSNMIELIARSWARLAKHSFNRGATLALVEEHDTILELVAGSSSVHEIELAVRHHHIAAGARSPYVPNVGTTGRTG